MLRQVNIKNILWIDAVDVTKNELYSVVRHYNFHELDIEACLEENQRARIDYYDDYMFITLHFPKYNLKTQIYELNEFNVFLGKDYIITFRSYPGNHIDKIFEQYSKIDLGDDSKLKVSSGYVLYEIIQAMLEKMFRVIEKISIDMKKIEKSVFSTASSSLVKDIMIKKRNIIMLKNMFRPQIVVLNQLEFNINKLFAGKIEAYFEDLEDKLSQIVNEINLLDEHISSTEVSYKTIIDIRTNSVIKILTVVSTYTFPMMLITSFYGMNVNTPMQNNPIFVLSAIFGSTALVIFILYRYFRDNKFK
ncbi:MAG: magnesium transporter CorA family protein [Candidatus Gracilibacteria bacterium]|nr:magnesium transporter CorA family protein [Candidatus Gracilibacteria bacterium]